MTEPGGGRVATAPAGARRTYSQQLRMRAEADPGATGIVLVGADGAERAFSLGEVESLCNRSAWGMLAAGVDATSLVAVALPNGVAHIVVTLAAWRLGACVLPVNPRLPQAERREILDLAGTWRPTFVVGDDDAAGSVDRMAIDLLRSEDGGPITDRLPHPGKAIGSGGSTGRPKIIVDPSPWARSPGDFSNIFPADVRSGEVQLVTGQLYHNTGFSLAHRGFFDDHLLILMERFDAELALDLIERHGVTFMACVPTMLQRMAKTEGFAGRDLSSVRSIYHTGGFAPDWMRLAWFEHVHPAQIAEAYGAAENFGRCAITGEEWLEHRGSVGRPMATELRILDEGQRAVGVGEVGEVFMRRTDIPAPTFFYVGAAPLPSTSDGLQSVGDLGFLDGDGYLHLVDRRVDMIVSGGANVYCAEVEQAVTSHGGVLDAAVVGLPDPDWGRRVHAVVEARSSEHPPDVAELERHVRKLLASFKVPKSWEFVERLPRDESGKLRRAALLEERMPSPAGSSSGEG